MKAGDRLLCIKKGAWTYVLSGEIYPYKSPKYGEIVTIKSINYRGSLFLVGYQHPHVPRHFIPLQPSTNALSKELAEDFIEQDTKVREQEVERVFSLTESF